MVVGDGDLSPLETIRDEDELADTLTQSLSPLNKVLDFSAIFGLSMSSFRKLDLRSRVRSATDGGFSGGGGAGPRFIIGTCKKT